MNILEICQSACRRAKEPQIADLFSNDDQAQEFLGYAEEASNIIFSAHMWRSLITDYSFTTILDGGEKITDYALPDDYDTMQVYFLYDLTRQLTLENSDDDASLLNEMLNNQGVDWVKWRIVGKKIRFDTPIEAGRELKYSYKSKYFVENIDSDDNVTYSQIYQDNTDNFLINDEVLILGILWQRSLILGFPDTAIKESKFKNKLQDLINEDGGLRKTNIFSRNGYKRISGMNYSTYPFNGE